MAGCLRTFVTACVVLFWTAATGLQHRYTTPLIPNTDIPIPANFSDYTRGREPWPLFPPTQALPGERHAFPSTRSGVPVFLPNHLEQSPETFIIASAEDPINYACSPHHTPAGHDIYNVWVPEILPYIVPLGSEIRTDAAVIIAPGGGSVFLAWDTDGIFISEWLNSIGISAFALKYRVPSMTGTEQLIDAQRAVSLVRSRAAEFGLSPDRIGLMGFSHGGDVIGRAGASQRREYQPIDAVDSMPFQPSFLMMLYPQIPENVVDLSAVPKTFLAFTADDPCCPAATTKEFISELSKVLPPEDLFVKEFQHGGHGWSACEWLPFLRDTEVCTWKTLAEAWLRTAVLS